jgi:glycosyltransferase involved in cell wall biosynthesis
MTTAPHPNALAAASRGRPTLSALIPVHREDPCALIAALADEIARQGLGPRVEVLVLDDGSADPALAARIEVALTPLGVRGRLLREDAPIGRAAARNRLAAAAQGAWSLFLDADLRPASDDFLGRWIEVIAHERPWIAMGGLKSRTEALGQALAPGLAPASGLEPAASLLVRCEILAQELFDETFHGHGWEDVEWAVRARRHAPIQIVEAPAVRAPAGDDAEARERCRSAARNFARLVRRHPKFARTLPAFRAAQLFAVTPGLVRLRPLLEQAARKPGPLAPARIRAIAADLWRASWYGEALR